MGFWRLLVQNTLKPLRYLVKNARLYVILPRHVADIGVPDSSVIYDRQNIKNGAFRRSTKTHPSGTSETAVKRTNEKNLRWGDGAQDRR